LLYQLSVLLSVSVFGREIFIVMKAQHNKNGIKLSQFQVTGPNTINARHDTEFKENHFF
jgi:hypothetical protein